MSWESYSFDDITPLSLNPDDINIAAILYSDEYKKALGLLKALQTQNEYSARAIFLTEQVIKLNAAHYSVWQYRYHNIVNLKMDIDAELDWCEDIAVENIKNYQIWHYRQLLLTKQATQTGVRNSVREFPLIEVMLDDDSKNYHVWSYRKWVVKWSGFWDLELELTKTFIDADVYNNSAWSHRYFALFDRADNPLNDDDSFAEEVEFVVEKIKLAPQNVSSWNYLIGIHEGLGKTLTSLKEQALTYANVVEIENDLESIPALELLIRIYNLENQNDLVIKGYNLLSEKFDPIRSNYWNYKKGLLL